MNTRPDPTSATKFVAVVCVVCIGLFNPLSVGIMVSTDGAVTSMAALAGLLTIDLSLMLAAGLLWNCKLGRFIGPILSICSVILMLTGTIAADRMYARWLMPPTASLLFPSFSSAVHETDEFKLNVHINNLGFRGPNINPKKTRKRVVVIGDSFTFGWGVPDADTWVQMLDSAYPDIEVLNLGRGGAHPGDHVQVLRQALPLLQPDLVVVGILQANDLNQLMRMVEYEEMGRPEIPMPKNTGESTKERWQRYLFNLYPNLMTRFRPTVNIGDRWKYEAEHFGMLLTDSIKQARYNAFAPDVLTAFHAGRLNPSLIFDAVQYPNLYLAASDTSSSLYQKGLARLTDHLAEMKSLCTSNGAGMMVLSVPNRPFICAGCEPFMNRVGQYLNGQKAPLPLGDYACVSACGTSGLPCITFTDAMRLKCPNNELFFALDGHYNVNGNRTFGHLAIKALSTDPQWKALQTSSPF